MSLRSIARGGAKPTTTLVGTATLTTTKNPEVSSDDDHTTPPNGLVNDGPSMAQKAPRYIPFPDLDPSDARIAMSACLLGHKVQPDATSSANADVILQSFQSVFKFIPVCPEVDLGLGAPRVALRLVGDGRKLNRETDLEDLAKHVQLWNPSNATDLTEQMQEYAKSKVDDLRSFGCDGFILKATSATCGMGSVKLYQSRKGETGRKIGQGVFAAALMAEWPQLAVSEEGRLTDEDTRNNFVQHVECHARWRQLTTGGASYNAVCLFHRNHKHILLAQDPDVFNQLQDELDQGAEHFQTANIASMYYDKFFAAMKVYVARSRHVDVLRLLSSEVKADGALKKDLYSELDDAIEDFAEGLVPLVVPLRLLQVLARSTAAKKKNVNSNNKETDEERKNTSLLLDDAYIQGSHRALKLHTSISRRVISKLPLYAMAGNGGDPHPSARAVAPSSSSNRTPPSSPTEEPFAGGAELLGF